MKAWRKWRKVSRARHGQANTRAYKRVMEEGVAVVGLELHAEGFKRIRQRYRMEGRRPEFYGARW